MRKREIDISKDILIVMVQTLYQRLKDGDKDLNTPLKTYSEKQLRRMGKKDLNLLIEYMLMK